MADQTLLNIGREGHLNPIQADDLRRQLQSEGITFSESQGPNGTKITASIGGAAAATGQTPVDLANQMYELNQKYAQPAIATLESGRPQIASIFGEYTRAAEAEKAPLEQRYQSLLEDITRQITEAQANEFTRRGIPLSSGAYEMAKGKTMAPYIQNIGLERESGLRNLVNLIGSYGTQQSQMGMDLNSAIAAIQAAQGPSAINAALGLYSTQQSSAQSAAELALQRWIAEQQSSQGYWQGESAAERALKEAQAQYYQYQSGQGGNAWSPTSMPFQIYG